MPLGSFNEDAQAVWDFVRCQRPDGSFYGTSGKCKAGKEVGAKEVAEAKPKKAAAKKEPAAAKPKAAAPAKQAKAAPEAKAEATPKISQAQKTMEKKVAELTALAKGPGGSAYVDKLNKAKAKLEEIKKAAATPDTGKEEKKALAAYQKLMKKQQALVAEGKMNQAQKLNGDIEAARKRWEESSKADKEAKAQLKKTAEEKAAAEKAHKELVKKLNDRQMAAYHKMNDKDMAAIKDYTNESNGNRSYNQLNKCLRKPPCLKPGVIKHTAELDAALKKVPANTDGDAFYRGMPVDASTRKMYEALRKAKPGAKIKDPGFGSYSVDERTAKDFQIGERKIMFVNRNKQLRPINLFSSIPGEGEAILPRGVSSTIRKVTEDANGNLTVELD